MKNGIVCFIDLLGYRSFVNNNSTQFVADKIKELLTIPNSATSIFDVAIRLDKEKRNNEKFQERMEKAKKVNYIFISDSIIIYHDIDINDDSDAEEVNFIIYTFIQYIRILLLKLHMDGFPVRGCIGFGEYYVDKSSQGNIFAGKVLNDCYEYVNNLEMSTCVVHKNSEKAILEKISTDLSDGILLPYNAIFKSKEMTLMQINWFTLLEGIDPEFLVFDSFHQYKSVTKNVIDKMDNTIRLAKYCKWCVISKQIETVIESYFKTNGYNFETS